MIINNIKDDFKNINEYYIEKLDLSDSSNWNKKYFDATYIESNITYNDSKMLLKFKINIASRSNLPMGVFLVNISMPGMEIKNIPIYNTFINPIENIKNYPKWICNIYEGNIEIDLLDNKYFHREIFNENIKLNFNFNIDIDTFKNNNISYNNESLSMLFYELNTKNIELNFSFSNTLLIDKSNDYYLPISNTFNSNGVENFKNIKINFFLPKIFKDNRIFNLFSIFSETNNIHLNGYEIKFFYNLENEYKELIINEKEDMIIKSKYDMTINKKYKYDFFKNDFIKFSEKTGIIFPFKTFGNYEVSFNLNLSGKKYKIYLKNSFILNDQNWIKSEIENIEWTDYEKI